MIKSLSNLTHLEVKSELNEYHFKSSDGALVLNILNKNIIYFSYNFKEIHVSKEAIIGSSFLRKNYKVDDTFNFLKDTSVKENDSSYTILFKSKLKIVIEKAFAIISIYKDNILIHGGIEEGDHGTRNTPQLKVFKAKGDNSFKSQFYFKKNVDDKFYELNETDLLVDKTYKLGKGINERLADNFINHKKPLLNNKNFYLKLSKEGKTSGFLFDQFTMEKIGLDDKNLDYYSVTSYNFQPSFYYIDGNNYKEILNSYYEIVGFPCFPPLFTFGYLGPFFNLVNETEKIKDFMQKIKDYKIPCEGLFASSNISKDNKIDNLQSINKNNFQVSLNVKGQVDTNQSLYNLLDSKGYFIKNEFGNNYKIEKNGVYYSLIDFTNEKACLWWKGYIKELFKENSYSGIWYEQSSFEIDDPGVDIYSIQAISSKIMCNVFQEGMNELTKDNYKRRHWITNKDEKYQLYNTCNTETIQSYDLLSTSQLMRAIENAVLSTSFVIPNALYRYLSKELQNSNEILSKILELAKAHYAFLPFIYNVAFQAHSKGIPIYRNLSLEFDDERVDYESTECLFGDSILKVAIKNEEQSQKDVYLPKDYHWYNSANKKFYYGGAKIAIDASLGLFNYFVKEGSIIPFNKESGKKLKTALFKNIDLKIYRIKDDKKTISYYFEDDGISSLDEERYNSYKFELSRTRLIVTKIKSSIKSSRRIFNICNEVGTKVSCFDPDKLEEGESISYKL